VRWTLDRQLGITHRLAHPPRSGRVTRIPCLIVSALLFVPAIGRADDKDVYRIGIPKSAFRDVPPALLSFAGMPFKDLMKSQTGLDGEVILDPDAMNIARQMDSGKLQLGV